MDVEDWFHAAVMHRHLSRLPGFTPRPRLVENLAQLRDWLSERNIYGTFFCLSSLPHDVNKKLKDLNSDGHEIASHGRSHKNLYELNSQELKCELIDSKKALEDLTGCPVIGFRAPNFSITDAAIEALLDAGYKYDSSVYNVGWHPAYGRLRQHPMKTTPYLFSSGLKELPLSVWEAGNLSIPISGGAYLRHFPFLFFKQIARRLMKTGYFHFYIHPWEIDQSHPVPPKLGLKDRLRHFRNIDKVLYRIEHLSQEIQFRTIKDYIEKVEIN